MDPAVEVAGDILDGLAGADGTFGEDGIAAELFDGEFEGEAGAEGSFFKEQGDGFAGEGMRLVAGRLLDIEGGIEEAGEFVVGDVEVAAEVGGRDTGSLMVGEGESGHGGTSL